MLSGKCQITGRDYGLILSWSLNTHCRLNFEIDSLKQIFGLAPLSAQGKLWLLKIEQEPGIGKA